jgi:acyl carrier protein
MKTRVEIERHIAIQVEDITFGLQSADKVLPDHRLIKDLGLDSLDYAAVLLRCEQWLGFRVREHGVDWNKLATVSALAGFLQEQQRFDS